MGYPTLYQCVHFLISLQFAWGVDNVALLNPPQEPVNGQRLRVRYSCDGHALVRVDCLVTFDDGLNATYRLGRWRCDPGQPRVRAVKLGFPDWLVYRGDGIIPGTHWVQSSILVASLRRPGQSEGEDGAVLVQDLAELQSVPPLSRPLKKHDICPSWGSRMIQLAWNPVHSQCTEEKETVNLLSSIYASSGENFGLTKSLGVYRSEVLENTRLNGVSYPWCMFSVWLFVMSHCDQRMCSVFHHIDSDNNYVTPVIFLTRKGQLHFQMNGEAGESSAFLSLFTVPLRQWCHLRVVLRGRAASINMACTDGHSKSVYSTEYTFKHSVVLDDTEGYFVIGGGKFMRGVDGYYGPVVYHRNTIPSTSKDEVDIPYLLNHLNLTRWLNTCQNLQNDMRDTINGYSLVAKQEAEAERNSGDFYYEGTKNMRLLKTHCEPWEAGTLKRRQAANVAKLLSLKHGGRSEVSLASVGKALYSLALSKLEKSGEVEAVSRVLPLLLQSGCLGENRSLHMAAVLYNAGLGVRRQPTKAWLLALLGAQQDSRLSLMHLGRAHHQGDRGLPADQDLAYAYYGNIAKQSSLDRLKTSPEQAFVEAIYLTNEEALRQQTSEDHHLFQWLKLQAHKGAASAEQTIGRMLFWGQQGLSADTAKAVRHYERGAVRLQDPASMYDYAIVLMQGHWVKKDVPRAVAFLKRAKQQGFVPATNALAWYYEQFERDYKRAVELWEEADLLGSPDAAMNLGVMYSQGHYPGKPANKFMAYKYYLKSAQRGHLNGAIHLSELWTSGIPGLLQRRPADAVLWSKWVSEHNGYLGIVLRKALKFHLNNESLMSLLYYLMAAESGYAPAQFNTAHICEQNSEGFLDPVFAAHCVLRYYNLTVHSQNPDTKALIKLGDLFYEGRVAGHKDMDSAAQKYKRAALMEDPQGWYSLGLLVEQDYRLPLSVLIDLGLPDLYLADKHTLQAAMYTRCRDSESTEAYLPCSLALVNVYLQSFQRDYSASLTLSSLVVVVITAPPIVLLLLAYLRGIGLSRH
ncbi:protein sel-1 homolog 3 [Gadus chalcogrammus]|uniref:protein sel-1 homolog 3 n=1 Tax=Gadus chalcogrammus TaxID=1042646 RepID=UPI0024C4A421|nr:protein sel-1 homolog 3 [Gadus chalcogrammus]